MLQLLLRIAAAALAHDRLRQRRVHVFTVATPRSEARQLIASVSEFGQQRAAAAA